MKTKKELQERIQKLEQILKDNLLKSSFDGEIACKWLEDTPWTDPDGILEELFK